MLVFACQSVLSQSDTASAYILPELKIYHTNKGESTVYIFKDNRNKLYLTNSTLFADPEKDSYSVNLNQITKISFRNGTYFRKNAALFGSIGFAGLFALGGFFSPDDNPNKQFHIVPALVFGIAGGLAFALVGGMFGLISPKYDDYSLIKYTSVKKVTALKKLFRKYSERR